MSKLKQIIFDLGAVLYDIDFKKTAEAFKNLGFNNFDEMYTQYHVDEVFEKLEIGAISSEDFCNTLLQKNSNNLQPQQIIDAWNAILIGWRKDSIAHLQLLSTNYKLYLLSNTNIIHQNAFLASFEKETGFKNFNSFFTKPYYSHEISLRKPNKNIFEFVLKDANLLPKETLFIDDSFPNIDAAKALGFKTHLLLANERIENLDFESF
jgi:glucose-1-phosphatase